MTKRSKKRRRRKARKMPLSAAAGLAATAFASPKGGSWSSPWDAIQSGNFAVAMQSALANLAGITLPMAGTGYTSGQIFDVSSLNPFDMNLGAGWKTAMWAGITFRIVNSITGGKGNAMLKAIPFIGKKLSFS